MANMDKKTYDALFKKEDEERKGSPWLFVSAVVLALVAIILLSVFLASYLGVVHLRSEDGGSTLTDPRKDITYELAPMCYEPVAYDVHSGVYAKYGDTEYYMVRDADPTKYLCTIDMNVYDLYYANDISLPSLAEFAPNYTRVCKVEAIAVMIGSIEAEDTEKLVDYYLSANTVDSSLISGVEETLYLKFMSEEYNFMYYNLVYYKTKNGERYLYDRTVGRCVDIGSRFSDVL
ncbi:MAG: hypothetical protein IKB34_00225 [Clostridia bacterium]|nr:hypothetical protein [Clostridia bacterium]